MVAPDAIPRGDQPRQLFRENALPYQIWSILPRLLHAQSLSRSTEVERSSTRNWAQVLDLEPLGLGHDRRMPFGLRDFAIAKPTSMNAPWVSA